MTYGIKNLWDVMPFNVINVYLCFKGTYCLHFQSRRVSQSSIHQADCSLLSYLIFDSEDEGSISPRNIGNLSNRRHGVTSQEIVSLNFTALII
jgi:hypothetical protein